jgi:hypothetical protein
VIKTRLIRNWFATDSTLFWRNFRGLRSAAIEEFIQQRNANPKPIRWTKPADDILASIERSAAAPWTHMR